MLTLETIQNELSPKVTVRYNGEAREMVRAGTSWNDIEKVNAGYGLSSSRDYIALASDFPAEKRPALNDRIEDDGTVWRVYRLADEECWRFLGNESTGLIRIHCRRV